MKTFYYYLCDNHNCTWLKQLVIIKSKEVAPGVVEAPTKLTCACGWELMNLRVRGE